MIISIIYEKFIRLRLELTISRPTLRYIIKIYIHNFHVTNIQKKYID